MQIEVINFSISMSLVSPSADVLR